MLTTRKMRWMLSGQLIAAQLNVLHGFLDGVNNHFLIIQTRRVEEF